jgi:hypothetical protein
MRPGLPVANDCTIFAARRSGTVAQIAVLSFKEGGAPRYENTGREERDNLNRSIPRTRPPRLGWSKGSHQKVVNHLDCFANLRIGSAG